MVSLPPYEDLGQPSQQAAAGAKGKKEPLWLTPKDRPLGPWTRSYNAAQPSTDKSRRRKESFHIPLREGISDLTQLSTY